jgi:hypothetical protein
VSQPSSRASRQDNKNEAPVPDALRASVLHRLACQRALHDPVLEPRNRDPRLPELRRWQMQRLAASFKRFLEDPVSRPAAEFFLSDLYGDHDFSGRDNDVARILPLMTRILPVHMIATTGDALALSALSHAFDLRMAEALSRMLDVRQAIDACSYAEAYRMVGHARLRREQIVLIERIGAALDAAVHAPTLWRLLQLSRLPAKLAGLGALQSFLERGFGAFRVLGGADDFVGTIVAQEIEVSRRLLAGDPDPFAALPGAVPDSVKRKRP